MKKLSSYLDKSDLGQEGGTRNIYFLVFESESVLGKTVRYTPTGATPLHSQCLLSLLLPTFIPTPSCAGSRSFTTCLLCPSSLASQGSRGVALTISLLGGTPIKIIGAANIYWALNMVVHLVFYAVL